jgi:phosphate acyltransferase
VCVPPVDTTELEWWMQRKRNKIRIGIDLMGADTPPELFLRAAENTVPLLPSHVELWLIGASHLESRSTLPYVSAKEVILMEDHPLTAIRRKKNSSLCMGLRMLKEGEIDALVSAGNTGALVFGAKAIISMVHGLLRPALCALIPTKKQPLAVLDVGANVQCKAVHLVQFALMGAAYQRARVIVAPSVGLLNIGREALKGTSELRVAYQELQRLAHKPHPSFQFAGNIEGKSVFEGVIDVLITDGFAGNVFLKTAEGIASLILDRITEHMAPRIVNQIGKDLADLRRHLHYAEYPGALLCGIRGIVIKCHGYSSPEAFSNGILAAVRMNEEDFNQILQDQFLRIVR